MQIQSNQYLRYGPLQMVSTIINKLMLFRPIENYEREPSLSLPITYEHFTCLIFLVPIIFCVRWAFIKLVKAFYIRAHKFSAPSAQKIGESMFYFVQYIILYSVSLNIIQQKRIQPFNFKNFFTDYPYRTVYYDNDHKLFMLELAVYIVSIIFLQIETRKTMSDYHVMVMHHIVTCTLVCTGYYFRHFNYGLIVMNLHDITDVFLEGSKLVNYTVGEPWSVFSFACFMILFFVTRIIVFPLYLMIPTLPWVSKIPDREVLSRFPNYDCSYFVTTRIFFTIVLTMLFVLDVYWMKAIFKMFTGIIRLEVRGDVRDGDEVETGRHRNKQQQKSAYKSNSTESYRYDISTLKKEE